MKHLLTIALVLGAACSGPKPTLVAAPQPPAAGIAVYVSPAPWCFWFTYPASSKNPSNSRFCAETVQECRRVAKLAMDHGHLGKIGTVSACGYETLHAQVSD